MITPLVPYLYDKNMSISDELIVVDHDLNHSNTIVYKIASFDLDYTLIKPKVKLLMISELY
jgi:hypothetical protein